MITSDPRTDTFTCTDCGAVEQDLFKVTKDGSRLVCIGCGASIPWPPPGSKESTEATAVELALIGAGFTYEPQMGGGCTAWSKNRGGLEILLVHSEGNAPTEMTDPVSIYIAPHGSDAEGNDPTLSLHFPSVSAFIAATKE